MSINESRYTPAMGWQHGTDNGYTNHGCRCTPCTRARSVYARAWRERTPIPEHVHGSYNGYTNYLCRCEGCRRAYSETKARAYRARKAKNAPSEEGAVQRQVG